MVDVVKNLVAQWRAEAGRLRMVEANGQAATFELAARELEAAITRTESELLSIAEASAASGYSEDHLRKLARDNELPFERAPGRKSRIRIKRSALPRKKSKDGRAPTAAIDCDASEDARNIAMQLRR